MPVHSKKINNVPLYNTAEALLPLTYGAHHMRNPRAGGVGPSAILHPKQN